MKTTVKNNMNNNKHKKLIKKITMVIFAKFVLNG